MTEKTTSRAALAKAVKYETQKFVDATVQQLDALSLKRDQWETGSFKKANDELYGLLADTLGLYLRNEQQLASTTVKAHGKAHANGLREELCGRLKQMGVKVLRNSSTLNMLVRYVFKSDRKRAHGYAQVLGAAIQENITPAGLPGFITSSGGIEEIKRRMVVSAKALEKRNQIDQVTNSVKAEVEFNALNPMATVALHAEGEYAVLLAKPNGEGFVDIVGVLPEVTETLANALMLRIAKQRVANGTTELAPQMPDVFAQFETDSAEQLAIQA